MQRGTPPILRLMRFAFCLLMLAGLWHVTSAHATDSVTLDPPVYDNPDPPDDPDEPDSTIPDVSGACGFPTDCGCYMAGEEAIFDEIPDATDFTRNSLYPLFWSYQNWVVSDFFDGSGTGPGSGGIRGAMMAMAEQLSTVGMHQVAIFGTFLDAKSQLQAQAVIQSLDAEAHKRYQSDLDMCSFGTMSEGLAAADQNATATAVIMAKRSIGRQLNDQDSLSRNGIPTDLAGRLQEFITYYCDPNDAGSAYQSICPTIPTTNTSINRDIDYTRDIEHARTLDVDLTDNAKTLTTDERDLFALDANLFAHDVFRNLNAKILAVGNGPATLLEARSIVAKRSVAENSFFAIAGMRADGSTDTTAQPYMKNVLKSLGVADADAGLLLGSRPSYYALMELMASKAYEGPAFFTNLYDTPANIARKDTAMQAIGLMLDRDQYKSELRSEADMAVLLELELDKVQDSVQGRANWLNEGGRKN